MAIIDNHKQVKIDKAFSDKHVEMFAFFDSKGIDVEVSDNFKDFQHFLTHLSPDDYPYRYDISFNDDNLDLRDDTYANNAFALYLKKDNKIIATYAAKELGFSYFVNDFIEFTSDEKAEFSKDFSKKMFDEKGTHMYSSCQWVSKDHRGKRFGMILDHLKKNICFDIFNADINYAIHKSQFADYHIKGLHYDESKYLATIPNGDVGGAGEAIDKVYNIAWTTKDEWLIKRNEVKSLYTS